MKFHPNWKSSWRWWSMRLNALAAGAVTYLWLAPEQVQTALNSLPADVRARLSPLIFIGVAGLVAFTRLYQQKGLNNDQAGK